MSDRYPQDPDNGGIQINDNIKSHVEKRIMKFAEANLAGKYTKLDIRFRDKFCYVDAYVEPEEPVIKEWPPDFPETREEHMERMRNTPIHLCRLRYFGNDDEWGLAFYSYAHNKYETSAFPNGKFFDTPEMAMEAAVEFYL
ncbi:hypothetical protein SAMN02746065_10468 [Desulfocicer vacuolatum DSM 3385]|uniref:Uncharacterized protein n=1 Tax=Desulfocicer vacuolatum DSM 3385 TaxID=1121400 RepID=A0A1W2A3P1_9BACT|nr:hypothetical protein [Desulfocicer vacuolatum]SMC55193.1 hypothetical protein SAMN02746065_10468 [Desulfocicer vacuolatum DSM 3385]